MILATALALRLLNPNDVAVDATLHCAEATRVLRIDARDVLDAPERCANPESLLPLVELRTSRDDDGAEWQRDLAADADCEDASMSAPLFACRSGIASASVYPVPGATYAWSVDGATITSGGGTSRVTLQLGEQPVARLTCIITTEDCTTTATGAISVREPIVVKTFTVPATAAANQPVTIQWSYEPGHEPASQQLTGDAFEHAVDLDAALRTYTFTPHTGGARTIALRASYARAIAPATKKRRRAASGGVTASECPSAQASAKIDVRGCVNTEALIDAPVDAGAGALFEAFVSLESGQTAEWSAENGTVEGTSGGGEHVYVRAGTTGQVQLSVRVQRQPGCFATGNAMVGIILPSNQCAIVPTATLAYVTHDCTYAQVKATFTGMPPFAGTWSDGTSFRVESNVATHPFDTTGVYSIRDFHDSSCFGTVSGSASLDRLRPSAKLEVLSTSCGIGRVVATFEGVPPFSGTWSDGQPFTVDGTSLERQLPTGTWSIRNLTDAACASAKSTSNAVDVGPVEHASMTDHDPYCIQDWFVYDTIKFGHAGGSPPYVYQWSDGSVSSSSPDIARTLYYNANQETQLITLQHVFANGCDLPIDGPTTATILSRRMVQVNYDNVKYTNCTGTEISVPLRVGPSPSGHVEWEVSAPGRIVRGQRTDTVTFTADDPGTVYLRARTVYGDNYCFDHPSPVQFKFIAPGTVSEIIFSPTSIPINGTAGILFKMNGSPVVSASAPYPRSYDLKQTGSGAYSYHDTQGAGSVPITLRWTDSCTGVVYEEIRTLTIGQ